MSSEDVLKYERDIGDRWEKGKAEADAEKEKQLATVAAQVELSVKIGENKDYQAYLIKLAEVEANKEVGIAQASALKDADVKIIANSGTAPDGIKKVTDLFNSQGGQQLGAMLEGLAQTAVGDALLKKVTGKELQNSATKLN